MGKRRTLMNGRGVGPSKVAPDEILNVKDDGAREAFRALVGKTGWAVEDGEIDGVFDTVTDTIKVVRKDGIPVTLILDGTRVLNSGQDLADAAAEGGTDMEGGADEERLTLTQIEQMPKETTFARMQSRWDTPADTRPAWKKPFTSRPQPREVEERVALGRFVGTKTEGTNYNGVFIIKFERPDGRPMEVRYEGTDAPPVTDIFVDTRGGRRSRLNVQRRRTQRNRRNRVGRKARKLATRRR